MKGRNKSLAALGILISLFVLVIFVESIIFRDELNSLITAEAQGYGYFFIMIVSAVLEFLPNSSPQQSLCLTLQFSDSHSHKQPYS